MLDIIIDIQKAIPKFNQKIYINFVKENPELIKLLNSQAISYWNAYFRKHHILPEKYGSYPTWRDFPAIKALEQICNFKNIFDAL